MNPTVDHVLQAFEAIPETGPAEIWIDTSRISLPNGEHFQGIQRLSGERQLLVMTHSSSNTQGYFVAAEVGEQELKGRAFSPVTMSRWPFIHAGGCQSYGNVLVAGVEDPNGKSTSEVQFWDFNRFPVQLIPMTIPRTGPEMVSTAGAVGISSFENGAIIAVATWNAGSVDFYISDADPFAGSPFTLKFTWTLINADKTNWIDQNWAHYQSVNLITETTTGRLFMVAFYRGDNHADWMDLYTVDLTMPQPVLMKKAKKHMTCTNGCNFNAGAGIFIPSRLGFEVLAVSYYNDNDVIAVNRFSALAP